jgi:hypothetical protein
MKALSITNQKIWPMLKYLKSRSNFKVKVCQTEGQKLRYMYQLKGLVTRDTDMKYEKSPITYTP